MQVQNAYAYVRVGLHLRMIRGANATYAAMSYKNEWKRLNAELAQLKFPVSSAWLSGNRAGEVDKKLTALSDVEPLGELASELIVVSSDLENVVFAEGLTKRVYVLADRRFQTEYLLSAPQKLLKDGAYAKLQPVAQADLASACRCVLFGEATAAAFHILRATEAVLKSYYELHRKTNRLEKPMWGPMTDQLRAKKRDKPSTSLLDSLDVVRKAYRNPTQHPEALYEIDAAQDLMGVCLDLIGKMAAEL
jgi:hypothetical protein